MIEPVREADELPDGAASGLSAWLGRRLISTSPKINTRRYLDGTWRLCLLCLL